MRTHGANFTNDSQLNSCFTQIKDGWIGQQWTRPYLLDAEVIVETDHAALLALRSKELP